MSEKAAWQRQVETRLAAAAQRKQAIQPDRQRQMTETECRVVTPLTFHRNPWFARLLCARQPDRREP